MDMTTWEEQAFAYGREQVLKEDINWEDIDIDDWLDAVKYDWTTYNLPLMGEQMKKDINDVFDLEMLKTIWFESNEIDLYDMLTNADYMYVAINDIAFENVWAELQTFIKQLSDNKFAETFNTEFYLGEKS